MSSRDTAGCPSRSYSALTAWVRVRWSTDQSSIEAWPFESTNRSRLGQIGSCGSKHITRFQSVYTSGASAIGVPGVPGLRLLDRIHREGANGVDRYLNHFLVYHHFLQLI